MRTRQLAGPVFLAVVLLFSYIGYARTGSPSVPWALSGAITGAVAVFVIARIKGW
ncbi:hypothetical protein [Streptomyces sp. NPDC056244]|uniref:hypothetical protein n=1 Tax=Streptomyces sp. NPDC056244 TaxID=3345762 RepID=UPI0035E199BA